MKPNIIFIGLTLFSGYAVANVTPSGKELLATIPPAVQVCVSCHGVSGEGMEGVGPRLAGLSSDYLAAQIHLFQAGARQNPTMSPMAMLLQGDNIKVAADYFAVQPLATDIKPVLRGHKVSFTDDTERLAYQGDWSRGLPACVTCHGPSALGGGLFPRLAGQQASYIKTQLQAWQAGTRKGDADGMMANVANKLTVAEIDALANYFANLK